MRSSLAESSDYDMAIDGPAARDQAAGPIATPTRSSDYDMAIDGPAAFLWAAGPIATARVAGVLTVGRPTIDRRPPWPSSIVADTLASFSPRTIDLIDGHNDLAEAPVVGWLDSLATEGAGDFRFTGTVTDQAMIDRLRLGRGLAVSIENRSFSGRRHASTITLSRSFPAGWLLAVAILRPDERSAYSGSVLWIVDP